MAIQIGQDDSEGIFTEINITPLTDIFLVLLIIFMVTSSVMAEAGARSGVNVNLPKGAARDLTPGASDITVGITTKGEMVVDGKVVEAAELKSIFERASAKNAETQIVVQADELTHHGKVVGVMELAKSAGLHRLAIATKRSPK